MKIFAYSDETAFENEFAGSGCLISETPISDSVIEEALKNLRDERNVKDIKTINRGYFHAKDDSPNAHSCICRSIKKNITGDFIYNFIDKKRDFSLQKQKDVEIQNLTLLLSNETVTNLKMCDILFIVEEREDFTNKHFKNWIEEFYKGKERQVYEYPSIPYLFPNITLEQRSKKDAEPGLQVTDFILWAIQRTKRINPDNIWFKRLNLKSSYSFHSEDGLIQGGTYYLKRRIKSPLVKYPDNCLPVNEPTNEELFNSYLIIEQTLRNISKILLPDHVLHLKSKFDIVINGLLNETSLSDNLIRDASSMFIRLFDTLPIYKDIPEYKNKIWSDILTARKIASFLLHRELPHAINSCDYIAQQREIMIPKNRRPTHPGEILKYEFLEPLKITQQQLADILGITRVRVNEIILGKRKVTPDTAFRLAKYFNTTPEFWINLQNNLDMWRTFQSNKVEYEKIHPVLT